MTSLFDSVDKSAGMVAALDYLDVRYHAHRTGWQKVSCPYTDNHANGDRNPSCSVNIGEGAFKCHACGAHGDWARMLLDTEGMKINEAVRLLGLERDEDRQGDPTEGGLFLY